MKEKRQKAEMKILVENQLMEEEDEYDELEEILENGDENEKSLNLIPIHGAMPLEDLEIWNDAMSTYSRDPEEEEEEDEGPDLGGIVAGEHQVIPEKGYYAPGVLYETRPFYSQLFMYVASTILTTSYLKYLATTWSVWKRGQGMKPIIRMLAAQRMARRRWRKTWIRYGRLSFLWFLTFKSLNTITPWEDSSLNIPISAGLIALGYTARSKTGSEMCGCERMERKYLNCEKNSSSFDLENFLFSSF